MRHIIGVILWPYYRYMKRRAERKLCADCQPAKCKWCAFEADRLTTMLHEVLQHDSQ